MAGARKYEELIAWKLSVELRDLVYALTERGPAAMDFKFRSQIRDAASSAPRNIAEGFVRFHPSEFAPFVNVAKGSLAETQNHLQHGRERHYFDESEFTRAWRLSCRTVRATSGLHRYLRSRIARKKGGSGPRSR
jgi:four helix bundle protein